MHLVSVETVAKCSHGTTPYTPESSCVCCVFHELIRLQSALPHEKRPCELKIQCALTLSLLIPTLPFYFRNLTADVTRFVPTALRVKRTDGPGMGAIRRGADAERKVEAPKPQVTKDDAYSQFMREMEGLL